MGLVLLNSGANGYYLLSAPDRVAQDIYKYMGEFNRWLYNENNDHGYWVDVEEDFGSFRALSYDGPEAFTKWLNNTILKDSDAKAECLPRLDF